MPKKLRPAVDLMAFKCHTLKVKLNFQQMNFRNCPLSRISYKTTFQELKLQSYQAICCHKTEVSYSLFGIYVAIRVASDQDI
jgi:hypothetical protein